MFILSSLVLSAPVMLTLAMTLENRYIQTEAVCTSGFSWSDNESGMSPCLVAAAVFGSCGSGNYDVHPLSNGSVHYSFPSANDNTNTLCACSWSAYNLIQACTACQGFNQSVQNWTPYVEDCGGELSDSYFPPGIVFPDGFTIPFWAGTEPTQWKDARFNLGQAEEIANQNHKDLIPGHEGSKSKAGPIAGGVVAGVFGLALLAGLIYCIRKRKIYGKQWRIPGFNRSKKHDSPGSDLEIKASTSPVGISPMPILGAQYARPMSLLSPLSPFTRNSYRGSTYSLPQSDLPNGSAMYTDPTLISRSQMSPAPTVQMMNREDIIIPFPLDHPTQYPGEDITSGVNEISPNSSPRRGRVNPPAYSPYASDTGRDVSLDADHAHNRTNSVDTQYSLPVDSKRDINTNRDNISSIQEVVESMGLVTAAPVSTIDDGSSSGTNPSAGRRQVNSPTVTNPDDDIA